MNLKKIKIAVIGLGYVGLPLAVEFSKKYNVLGFDIDTSRISNLNKGIDKTNEVSEKDLKLIIHKSKKRIKFSSDTKDLKDCNIYIITVPTPIDKFKAPDLSILFSTSKMIGKLLKKNDIVIYESTVYPGCTEEECVPILENNSGLKLNRDFFCGYSPERINPGDKVYTLKKIIKVTSGSNKYSAEFIDKLYSSIIIAGTYMAPSIKVAEASKAIENAQRDLNISYVNELALIFDKLGIDTNDVIDAASTKWNFIKFKPGLVGGHCIGVDPYYLVHKAESKGYTPEVIKSGRRVNDDMGVFIANKLIKSMIDRDIKLKGSRVLILGITFKENCPDIRNSKVIDIYNELIEFGLEVDVYDPYAYTDETNKNFGIKLCNNLQKYEAIILAVSHNEFLKLDINALKKDSNSIVFDVKAFLDRDQVDLRL